MGKFKRKIKTLRKIVENHGKCIIKVLGGNSTDFGEVFCGHIHGLNMPFKILAKHFGFTLEELARVVSNHIKKL